MLLSLLFIIKGCCPLPPTPVVRRPTCEMLREIVFGRYLMSTSLSERCKKNAKSSRQLGFNSMAVKDGRLRAAARSEALTSLSEWSKKNAKSSCQLGSKHPSPRFNSMAVKDGRLRAAARSEGQMSLSERCNPSPGPQKNVLMKIRRKWVKKVRPCKIFMMYLLSP